MSWAALEQYIEISWDSSSTSKILCDDMVYFQLKFWSKSDSYIFRSLTPYGHLKVQRHISYDGPFLSVGARVCVFYERKRWHRHHPFQCMLVATETEVLRLKDAVKRESAQGSVREGGKRAEEICRGWSAIVRLATVFHPLFSRQSWKEWNWPVHKPPIYPKASFWQWSQSGWLWPIA